MALQGDQYFGFDLIQRKTLIRLLSEGALTPEQLAAVTAVVDLPTTDPGDGISVWNNAGELRVSEL